MMFDQVLVPTSSLCSTVLLALVPLIVPLIVPLLYCRVFSQVMQA
jgi:hypothetical protein